MSIDLSGKKVITPMMLGSTEGFIVHQKHLNSRKPNAKGTIRHYLPGHGGDVWIVDHEDGGDAAVYALTELAERPDSPINQPALLERTAQLIAHRACCGIEHDPANGKIHGLCVVCGVDWPCEFAGTPPPKEGELV